MVDHIGDLFLKLAPGLKAYEDYVSNIDSAINHVVFLQNSEKKFTQFLEEVQQTTDFGGYSLSLEELLMTPLNQINNYEIHLEAITNTLPTDHPGYLSLVGASALINETNKYLREAIVDSKNRLQVLQIQRLLDGHEVHYNMLY